MKISAKKQIESSVKPIGDEALVEWVMKSYEDFYGKRISIKKLDYVLRSELIAWIDDRFEYDTEKFCYVNKIPFYSPIKNKSPG